MKEKYVVTNLPIRGILALILLFAIVVSSCGPSNLWIFERDIELTDVSPNGIAIIDDDIWIADTDNNRLVVIDDTGKIKMEVDDVDRPMHMTQVDGKILVSEYGSDVISFIGEEKRDTVLLTAQPDAPASADINGDRIAVADFYNHRVILEENGTEMSIGEKGDGPGEFHYPTDVQFFDGNLYVADAYNHRVQVFDENGTHLNTIGEDQGMNAATGIYVTADYIIVTDFENDRVLTFTHDGELMDLMDEGFLRPTDVLVHNQKLYVLNFKGKFISIFGLNN